MGEHTPGPWFVNRWTAHIMPSGESDIRHEDGHPLAALQWPSDVRSEDETIANAHLIAAAPDLLEALEAAIDAGLVPQSSAKDGGAVRRVKQVQVADQIRAALSKARGESNE